jgi:hypothetical protein
MNLIAFHITWGTYGTRLHGDYYDNARAYVDRQRAISAPVGVSA